MAKIDVRMTCIACPVQIEGSIDGVPIYFRARGTRWSLGIGGDAVMAPAWSIGGPYGRSKVAAGWMPHKVAWRLLRKGVRRWALEHGYWRGPRVRPSRGWRRHVRQKKADERRKRYRFTATGLPPGLTMTPDGRLIGTPAAAGSFSFLFRTGARP